MKKIGLLLINLGTPDSASVPAVRRYLREFLSDPYVIDLPAPLRWLLLNTVILPFRAKESTKAYQEIWTKDGSPLLTNSMALRKKIQTQLGEEYQVELAMRYGNPSISSAISKLTQSELSKVIIIPLYPQYAESTTRSSLEYAKKIIKRSQPDLAIETIEDFYHNPHYIEAKSNLIASTLNNQSFDKLVFSYHGLPERHIHRTCQEKLNCDLKTPCPSMMSTNAKCYRAQCYATSHHIANKLGINKNNYLVTFQSRLGKTPWITPYTDLALDDLAKQGAKNIAIVCPSFVADCLETLEEIDIRAKQQWQALGGKEFVRIPCLNDNDQWVAALSNIIHD